MKYCKLQSSNLEYETGYKAGAYNNFNLILEERKPLESLLSLGTNFMPRLDEEADRTIFTKSLYMTAVRTEKKENFL